VILWMTLAGGFGAASRFAVDGWVKERVTSQFPWGILLVNVAGSFLLGFLTGLVLDVGADPGWLLVLGTGFCGGFTTFSTAMVDTVRLARDGAWRPAAANLCGNVVACLLAAAFGLGLAYLL
jgi:fluoride exporter